MKKKKSNELILPPFTYKTSIQTKFYNVANNIYNELAKESDYTEMKVLVDASDHVVGYEVNSTCDKIK